MISTDGPHTDHFLEAPEAGGLEAPPYALFARLTGRRCLVVGGGDVAARKVASLVEAGAIVDVVAPELGPSLAAELAGRRADGPGVAGASSGWTWTSRPFRDDDPRGCFLAVAATDDPAVNRRVAGSARRHGALVNVVDDPALCDFFVPSVMHRGPLQVAVSTGGAVPGISKRLRQSLEQEFSADWGPAVFLLGAGRAALLEMEGLDQTTKERTLGGLASLDVTELLDEGGPAAVAEAVDALIQEAATACTSRPSE